MMMARSPGLAGPARFAGMLAVAFLTGGCMLGSASLSTEVRLPAGGRAGFQVTSTKEGTLYLSNKGPGRVDFECRSRGGVVMNGSLGNASQSMEANQPVNVLIEAYAEEGALVEVTIESDGGTSFSRTR